MTPGRRFREGETRMDRIRILLALALAVCCPVPVRAGQARLVPQISGMRACNSVSFSSSGGLLAVTGDGVDVWSAGGWLLGHLEASYYPIPRYSQGGGRGATLSGLITSAAFLGDGRSLAAASRDDNVVRIFDVTTGKIAWSFTVPSGTGVGALAASEDGSMLAAGAADGTIVVWDAVRRRKVRVLRTALPYVSQLAFSGGKGRLVSAAREAPGAGGGTLTEISVWGASGKRLSGIQRNIPSDSQAFALSPGGGMVVVPKGNGVEIFDPALSRLYKGATERMASYAVKWMFFSGQGEDLTLAGRSGGPAGPINFQVFSRRQNRMVSAYSYGNAPGEVYSVSVSPDGRRVAFAGSNSGMEGTYKARLIASGSGELLKDLTGGYARTRVAVINPVKGVLASADPVRFWDWTGAWLPEFRGYVPPGIFNQKDIRRDPATGKTVVKYNGSDMQLGDMGQALDAVFNSMPDRFFRSDQMLFSRNGELLLYNSNKGFVRIMRLDGTVVGSIPGVPDTPLAGSRNDLVALLKPGGQRRDSGVPVVFDPLANKTVFESPVPLSSRDYLGLDPDGKYLAAGDTILELPGGGAAASFGEKILDVSYETRAAVLLQGAAEDGRRLLVRDWKNKVLGSVSTRATPVRAKFIKSGTELVAGYSDGTVDVRSVPELKPLKTLPGHAAGVTSLAVSDDEKFLVSGGADGVVRVTNLENLQSYSRVSVEDEWAIFTADGYFDASPRGGGLLAYAEGLHAFPVENFAARYNRPDLILERMGLGTPEQLAYFSALRQKRLARLGLPDLSPDAGWNMPVSRITGLRREGDAAVLDFELSGGGSALKRYQVYVNEIPQFGREGKALTGYSYKGSERVELGPGSNKLEVSVINEAGIESHRAAENAGNKMSRGGDLYYLGFGISKYKAPELALNFADKDAKDIEGALRKMSTRYDRVHIKTLLNSDATAANIASAKEFLKGTGVRDTVVLFIAGHGGYSKGASPKYYFLPYEANPKDPTAGGVDFESIEDLLFDIKARKKLFLMDTCESGELDEATFAQYYASATARGAIPRTFRRPRSGAQVKTGAARSFLYLKDRYIHNDLLRRSGAIVFSSSRGNELSYESHTVGNGFFTSAIIKALGDPGADKNKDTRISVDELREYVLKSVDSGTGGLQHPTIDRDNIYQGLDLPSLAY